MIDVADSLNLVRSSREVAEGCRRAFQLAAPVSVAAPARPVPRASESWGTKGGNGSARRLELREFLARISNHGGPAVCGNKPRVGGAGSSREILYRTRPCRCKWLCPTCGYAASCAQANRVRRRLRSWKANGGAVALLTLAQSHWGSDGLKALWDRMDAGWRALVRGSGWIADKANYALRGYFRNTEVVLNPLTGWHVHFHVILLLDVELDQFRASAT